MKKTKVQINNQRRERSLITTSILSLIFLALIVRMSYIVIYKGNEYRELAEGQWSSRVIVEAERGDITDRNGAILATSIDVYRVDLDLKAIEIHEELEETTKEEIAKQLADTAGLEYSEVLDKLTPKEVDGETINSSTLITGIEKSLADKIEALDIYGVIISISPKRYYPNNDFLAHVLGSVNSDNTGLNGIELRYDSHLTGISGYKIAEVDGSFKELPYQTVQYTSPVDGKDVTLTIDENIQLIAEKVAEEGLSSNKATEVTIVVSNPNNGEILAMVNKPDFNPNNPYEDYENFEGETEFEKLQNMFRNSAVSNTFEPGSTFKNVTMAAAIEEKVVHEHDTFYCSGGIKFGSITIKCWKLDGHGEQTLSEILQNSCNVGFMEVGARLGSEKLKEYIDKFGFGMATKIDLPGESEGIVKSVSDMSEMDLATIAFGQTNTVNSAQLVESFNAIVNGGDSIQLHLMKNVSYKESNGTVVIEDTFTPEIRKDIISDETSKTLLNYLEQTINQGTTIGAFMGEDRRVGAKTGTAQKVDVNTGGYSDTDYIASVVAVYPVEDPKITIYLKVEDPSTGVYYGGQVATPLLKNLLSELFVYMDSKAYSDKYTEKATVIVPELRGKTIKEAKEILDKYNLELDIQGDGNKVVNMTPYPGALVYEGSKISVNLKDSTKDDSLVIMPNLLNKSKEEAIEILEYLGLKEYTINGEGYVKSQSILKGKLIEKNTKVKLDFNN